MKAGLNLDYRDFLGQDITAAELNIKIVTPRDRIVDYSLVS